MSSFVILMSRQFFICCFLNETKVKTVASVVSSTIHVIPIQSLYAGLVISSPNMVLQRKLNIPETDSREAGIICSAALPIKLVRSR